jgi:hypothetical protein
MVLQEPEKQKASESGDHNDMERENDSKLGRRSSRNTCKKKNH